jgi:Na+/melibiose symporter-like transporter
MLDHLSFWMIIIGLVLVIISFILWLVNGRNTRWWFWTLLVIGSVIMVIGAIWYVMECTQRQKNVLHARHLVHAAMEHDQSQNVRRDAYISRLGQIESSPSSRSVTTTNVVQMPEMETTFVTLPSSTSSPSIPARLQSRISRDGLID